MLCVSSGVMLTTVTSDKAYDPTWESIDSRPVPQWFQEAKFGIFIHWGVYSVPAWGPKGKYAEWYWHDMQDREGETWRFHKETYGEHFQYQDFAPLFRAELFDPAHWADVFVRSNAKYIVLTSKHHEGFCLWPSAESWNWNSVDVGPHRDLCGELLDAVRARGLRMGFYYSLYEWFNPTYKSDVDRYVAERMLPQLKDLVNRYKPDLVWTDGCWEQTSDTWRSLEFLSWLYNESPVKDYVAVNDRWGKGCRGNHGGFYTTEYGHGSEAAGLTHPWEECRGMGKSFGYNRNETAEDYATTKELLLLLIDTVSRGGNLLLDIGPTADGRIPEIMEQRLLEMGSWLSIHGEAIFGTSAGPDLGLPWLRTTKAGNKLFLHIIGTPEGKLVLPVSYRVCSVSLMADSENRALDVVKTDNGYEIDPPSLDEKDLPKVIVVTLE